MSKRRLLTLVNEKYVNGWDDPRLLTLNGLRRRGYSSKAITDFCNTIGISRNETMIPMAALEHWARNDLEMTAKRAMCVVHPVKVILTNYPQDKVEILNAPDHPKNLSIGMHQIPFSSIIYIDRDDIRLIDDPHFFGLAPNKEVHLKYGYNIRATKIHIDPQHPDHIISVEATVDLTNTNKPKGKIHWVAQAKEPIQSPIPVKLNLYENLFKSKVKIQNIHVFFFYYLRCISIL